MVTIAVIGSINMDVVNSVGKHPLPGETVHGFGTSYSPGGKGANQAVAGTAAGSDVYMVGAVGSDAFGDGLVSSLADHGVLTKTVIRKAGTSGLAFITVDTAGENSIILSSGANGRLSPEDLERQWPFVEKCSAILLQNEIPWETSFSAMRRAQESGIRVYFNPAPAFRVPDEAFPLIHCLILNESEAEAITGSPVDGVKQEAEAMQTLLATGAKSVVLTLGSRGAYYMDQQGETTRMEAFAVDPVDTTAAGDTFIGSFATAREEGYAVADSLRFASAAAAISVTKQGAQQSVPKREETIAFLQQHEG